MRVAFVTLGCKVNTYESDAIKSLFIKRGATIVDAKDEFDACVINTCSVTNQATAKSRKMIRQVIRGNKNAIIAVIGCYAQMAQEEIQKIDGVDIIIGNADKAQVVDLIYQKQKQSALISRVTNILQYKHFEELDPVNFSRTRAFLKIEDGCNNFCSYCIIPYTRGPIRSKNVQKVIDDVNKIVNNGYKEIVLTGIHTGKYQFEETNFTALVKRIIEETDLARLRISSIELNEITDEFIELMKSNSTLAHHLHLPLQAGSNHVLKLMNRHYSKEDFIQRVKYIQELIPDISITTDIIVGFPEESEEDFAETLAVCQEIGFAKIHAFPFSLRNGTKACELKPVLESQKNKRLKQLLALDIQLQDQYNQQFINTTALVIIEDRHGDYLVGHSSNYLAIYVAYREGLSGKMLKVLITKYEDKKLYGEIID